MLSRKLFGLIFLLNFRGISTIFYIHPSIFCVQRNEWPHFVLIPARKTKTMTMTMICHCLLLGFVVSVPRPQCRFGSVAANFVLYNRSCLTPPCFLFYAARPGCIFLLHRTPGIGMWSGLSFFMPRFDLICYAMLSQIMLTFVLFNFCFRLHRVSLFSPLVCKFTGSGVFIIFIYCFYLLILLYGR